MPNDLLFSVTKRDLVVQTFRAGGNGGQNQNKRDTGVRVIHTASGAVGEARDSRNQLQNKRAAFKRMTETGLFKTWLKIEIARRNGDRARIEEQVDQDMRRKNLRVDVVDEDGKWNSLQDSETGR